MNNWMRNANISISLNQNALICHIVCVRCNVAATTKSATESSNVCTTLSFWQLPFLNLYDIFNSELHFVHCATWTTTRKWQKKKFRSQDKSIPVRWREKKCSTARKKEEEKNIKLNGCHLKTAFFFVSNEWSAFGRSDWKMLFKLCVLRLEIIAFVRSHCVKTFWKSSVPVLADSTIAHTTIMREKFQENSTNTTINSKWTIAVTLIRPFQMQPFKSHTKFSLS